MWTYNATKAILERQNETNDNAVYEFYNYCKLQINDMVEIVKGDLTGLERGLMTAMIVLDVHGRDVILELYEENTKNIHDF